MSSEKHLEITMELVSITFCNFSSSTTITSNGWEGNPCNLVSQQQKPTPDRFPLIKIHQYSALEEETEMSQTKSAQKVDYLSRIWNRQFSCTTTLSN